VVHASEVLGRLARVKPKYGELHRLREDRAFREELRERLDRYMDLPLALASILLVLLAIIQLSGEVSEPWESRLEILGWATCGRRARRPPSACSAP
jgi:hypothetical protein